jgi:hypothetical protein
MVQKGETHHNIHIGSTSKTSTKQIHICIATVLAPERKLPPVLHKAEENKPSDLCQF